MSTTITNLPETSKVNDSDYLVLDQPDKTVKSTVSKFLTDTGVVLATQLKDTDGADLIQSSNGNTVQEELNNNLLNDREQWCRSLAEAGLTLVDGSFEEGATANSSTDAVWHIAGGQCYTWDGAFPKAVPADSTPTSTGGVGTGAWVSVGNASLRNELTSSKGFTLIGGRDEVNDDIRAYVRDGDPIAPDYTQALKRAIASGRGRVYINVPVEIKEDLTIPRLFRVDVGENGYIYSTTNKVRIEGFINSIGGGDPYRNYIKQYGVDSSTVPGVYTYNVTVNVPEDYPTMQAAIDAVPDNYWQFITIQVSDGTYDEDLVIRNKRGCTPNFPPESGQQAILVITSKSKDRTKVSYRSAQVFSCGGTPYSPNLENLNFTNRTHSDENCSVEFYGCTSGAVNKCSFNGVGVDKCIEAYNSTISVEGCDFGTDINDKGMVVKHGGTIMSNSTRIGSALAPMSGVLKSWVAVAIGGTIIANDLGMAIGKVAQSRVDGVQAGVIIETATKSINGVTSSFRLDTTRHHTQFQDYDKFTNTVTGTGSGIEYYVEGGLVVRAGTAGGTAIQRYKRERRLVRQFENSNYLGFAVAFAIPSGVTALAGYLVCGSVASGNYFGIKYVANTAYGVIATGGVETTIALANNTTTLGTWTCKYVGKGTGQVIFMYDDAYAGHINDVKLASYDGTYFEANITTDRVQLYELEFISSM
ncbi:TPA: hypothetical protein NV660_003982 [Escherichia coli]|nr:hypothetical protein [Escherichia coli]